MCVCLCVVGVCVLCGWVCECVCLVWVCFVCVGGVCVCGVWLECVVCIETNIPDPQ